MSAILLAGKPERAPVANATAFWPMDAYLPFIRDYTCRGNDLTRDMKPAPSTLDFCVGTNDIGTQPVRGRIAKWGRWARLLTVAEKNALASGEGWPFLTTPSLADARAYFLYNEPSATATFADSTGRGNDLAFTGGSPTISVAGPLGTDLASELGNPGATVFQKIPVTADLAGGNVPCTVAGWVRLDSLGATQQLFWGQFDGGNRTGIQVMYYHAGNQRFQMDIGNDVDLYRNAGLVTDNFGAPVINVWYFLLGEYDPVTNTASLSVNGVANTLTKMQQPAPVVSGTHLSILLRVNPDYRSVPAKSGWDLVGKYVTASHASNADISIGNNARAVWGWVRFDDPAPTQTVMGIFDSATNHMDWAIQQGGGGFYFLLGDNAGGFNFCNVTLNDTNWHSFVCWYDKFGDGKIHIDLDNGAHVASAALTHVPSTSALPFIMGGATSGATQAQQMSGNLALAGMSNGVPTANDIAALYAAGGGLA